MSGIYIPSMEMPEESDMIVIYSDGTVRKYLSYTKVILDEAKAVPVPPHGRLVDADAMKTRIEGSDYHTITVVKQWVDDQPTVIDNEGE